MLGLSSNFRMKRRGEHTWACADISHSVPATLKMEKTTIKFRGSFSPSKYDTSREVKFGDSSCRAWIATKYQPRNIRRGLINIFTRSVLSQKQIYEQNYRISFIFVLVLFQGMGVFQKPGFLLDLLGHWFSQTSSHSHDLWGTILVPLSKWL